MSQPPDDHPATDVDEPRFPRRDKNATQNHAWQLPNTNSLDNPFLYATTQYTILSSLVEHLRPQDVLRLAQTSQTVYSNLDFSSAASRTNLRTKVLCPGFGVQQRKLTHQPASEGEWHVQVSCGSEINDPDMESRPCVTCGMNTCDECRLHVTYQSMTEDNGPHGLRWWAGHIMMANTPVRLLPPVDDFHWYPLDPLEDVEEESCWKVPLGKGRPQHDSGRVGLPFDSNEAGQAEPLDNLLDQDLGDTLLPRFKGSSYGSSRTRPIAGPLDLVVAGRLKRLCPTCSTTEVKHQCTCTFRKRFLDRWLCIECYLKNEARFDPARTVKTLRTNEQGECPCGNPFDPQNEDSWFVCKWCDGRVLGSFEKMDREEEEKSFVPDEEDEDEEGARPEMLPHGDRSNLDGRLIDQAIEDAGSKAPGLYLHMVCQEVLSRKHLVQMDAYKKKMEEGKDEEFSFKYQYHRSRSF